MVQNTANLDLKVSKKELVPGYTYLTKRNEKLTYLTNAALYTKRYGSSKKVLVFYDDTVNPKTYKKSLIFLSSTNSIAKCIDNTIDINHTAILSKFTKSSYMNPIAKIFIDPTKKEKDMYAYYKTKIMHMQVNPIKYTTAYISTDEKTNRAWVSAVSYETFLNNGVVTRTYTSAVSIPIINTIQDIDKLVNLGYVEGALMIELSNGQIERLHDDT
jgi:hypothetical protein